MDATECARIQYIVEIKKLKMSLVPLPCQECQLPEDTSSTQSECTEWLTDLKDKFNVPIWSRRLFFNTSGFQRELPMSMVRKYHVEIKGRLWSIWGHLRKCKPGPCNRCCKPFLGATVMGLCAVRVFRLNLWKPKLLDEIQRSGEIYFRESFKNFDPTNIEFDLKDLNNCCSLQGIKFDVFFKTVQQGKLYSGPLEGKTNLAYALLKFFEIHEYGILECFNRYLGFGFKRNIPGGYFMFDAQSMNYPMFCKNRCAPYLLRTNHLQILVYCLTVALNVRHVNAPFALHCININVKCVETLFTTGKCPKKVKPCECEKSIKRILPKECWDTPLPSSECSDDGDILKDILCGKDVHFIEPREPSNKLERRLKPRQIEECLGKFKVMPLVEVKPDTDEDEEKAKKNHCEVVEPRKDFIRMICSYTQIPLTPAEEAARISKSFIGDLSTILATGCTVTLQNANNENDLMKQIITGKKNCQ